MEDDERSRSRSGGRPTANSFKSVRSKPSIWLRYNYYIQLVVIKRNWMHVPNLDISPFSLKGEGKAVVHKAVHTITLLRNISESCIALIGLIPDHLPHSRKDLI